MIQNKSTFLLDTWFGGSDLQVSSETHLDQLILEFYLQDPNQVASKKVDLNALLCRCQHWNFEAQDLQLSIETCRDS
jgi:methylglyoxal synthase